MTMKVLIGCETSGIVRDAFLARGFDAWSCDLKPSETATNRHIQDDVRNVMEMENWDLLAVMHPPCTRLCNSGVRWLTKTPKNPPADATPMEVLHWANMSEEARLAAIWRHLDEGAALFSACWNSRIPRVAIENPVMHRHAKERIENFQPHAQSVQPWQFGTDPNGPDNERKRTCLWLRGLPKLQKTGTLDGSTARDSVHKATPGPNRATDRSRFFPGLAAAMAQQWGDHALDQLRAA